MLERPALFGREVLFCQFEFVAPATVAASETK